MARGVFSAGPNWPARGLIVRAPARADETGARRFAWLQYEGGRVIGAGLIGDAPTDGVGHLGLPTATGETDTRLL